MNGLCEMGSSCPVIIADPISHKQEITPQLATSASPGLKMYEGGPSLLSLEVACPELKLHTMVGEACTAVVLAVIVL